VVEFIACPEGKDVPIEGSPTDSTEGKVWGRGRLKVSLSEAFKTAEYKKNIISR
jgi:hypothetical protein